MTRKQRVIVSIAGTVALVAVLVGAGKAGTAAFRCAPDHAHIVVTHIQPPAGGQAVLFSKPVMMLGTRSSRPARHALCSGSVVRSVTSAIDRTAEQLDQIWMPRHLNGTRHLGIAADS